uniref:Variant surface glycoprotein 1125.1373 n=1 Tax=Trypanosoma brucei TaxID=5691 RepID=A0A1J0R6T8_9TRYP|nr:variant surface glycoprotein 1125.1373 [Trypanosoma brucei]
MDTSHRHQATALALTALLLNFSPARGHIHDTSKKLEGACDTSSHFTKLQQSLAAKLTQQITEIHNAKRKVGQLRAAAAMGNPATRRLLAPVLAATAELASQAESTLQTNAQQILDGIAAAAEIAAAEATVEAVSKTELESIEEDAFATVINANNGKPLAGKLTAAAKTACEEKTFEARIADEQSSTKFAQTITIPLFYAIAKTDATLATGGPVLCGGNNMGTTPCNHATSLASPNRIGIKGGPVLKLVQQTTTRKSDGSDNYAEPAVPTSNAVPTKNFFTSRLTDIKKAEDAASKLTFTSASVTSAEITNTATFQTLVLQIFLKTIDPKQKNSKQAEIDKVINKDYGKEDGTFKEKVWNQVEAASINQDVSGDASAKTLNEATETKVITRMEAYYLATQTTKAQECPQVPQTTNGAADKCKPDTKENECKNDKDCEFKDGKCKVKASVKAENDGKATNTTGSNSFVINKAPLLLAFLFLLLGFYVIIV